MKTRPVMVLWYLHCKLYQPNLDPKQYNSWASLLPQQACNIATKRFAVLATNLQPLIYVMQLITTQDHVSAPYTWLILKSSPSITSSSQTNFNQDLQLCRVLTYRYCLYSLNTKMSKKVAIQNNLHGSNFVEDVNFHSTTIPTSMH